MFDTENTNGRSVLSGQYTPAFASFYHGMIFCQTSKLERFAKYQTTKSC